MEPLNPKVPWYQKKRSLVVAVLVLGPLALPMLWVNPRYSLTVKIIWTILIVILTYLLMRVSVAYVQFMLEKMEELKAAMGS